MDGECRSDNGEADDQIGPGRRAQRGERQQAAVARFKGQSRTAQPMAANVFLTCSHTSLSRSALALGTRSGVLYIARLLLRPASASGAVEKPLRNATAFISGCEQKLKRRESHLRVRRLWRREESLDREQRSLERERGRPGVFQYVCGWRRKDPAVSRMTSKCERQDGTGRLQRGRIEQKVWRSQAVLERHAPRQIAPLLDDTFGCLRKTSR